jgi:hypothetical protein
MGRNLPSEWSYWAPYDADIAAALQRLREDVFARGDYATRDSPLSVGTRIFVPDCSSTSGGAAFTSSPILMASPQIFSLPDVQEIET